MVGWVLIGLVLAGLYGAYQFGRSIAGVDANIYQAMYQSEKAFCEELGEDLAALREGYQKALELHEHYVEATEKYEAFLVEQNKRYEEIAQQAVAAMKGGEA